MALLAKGFADAKAQGKLLFVTFGAPWCPWCANLQKLMPTAEILAAKGEAIAYDRAFHHIEIALSTLHKGKIVPIPSGGATLDALLARAPAAKTPWRCLGGGMITMALLRRSTFAYSRPRSENETVRRPATTK